MKYTYYDDEDNLVGHIPSELINLSEELFNNKSSRKTLLKTYCLILNKVETETRRRRNRGGKKERYFVYLSSSYFRKSILTGYKKYLDILVERRYVFVKRRELDFYERRERGLYIDLFDPTLYVETYKVGSQSKGYTILKFPHSNSVEIKFKLIMKESSFRIKNRNFLKSIGIKDIKMSQDMYGHRLYTNISISYKEVLLNKGSSFVYYDIQSSIPNVIKHYFFNKGYSKDPFLKLFNGDFYENWGKEIEPETTDRKKLKRNFNTYLNGKKNDYSPIIDKRVKSKYPLFYSLKNRGLGREMVKRETDLMLNKVVGNLPVDKVLTIHDGFIVYKDDEHIVDEYITNLEVLNGFNLIKK